MVQPTHIKMDKHPNAQVIDINDNGMGHGDINADEKR